jgi:hypothetical protein
MLHDKVYLWMVILSCVAVAVAGALCMVELKELGDPALISGPSPF